MLISVHRKGVAWYGGRCGNFCLDFYVTLDGKGNLSSFLKAAWHERCSVGSSLATIWADLMVLNFLQCNETNI